MTSPNNSAWIKQVNPTLCGVLLAIFLLALWTRLLFLPYAEVGSDSLGPHLSAMGFWHHGWVPPPNPESDHWLWVTATPFVLLSGSLNELFGWRFAVGATIAPLGALAAYLLASQHRYKAACLAGGVLVVDKGLIDTLLTAFRGYMAPEWIALMTVGIVLVLRGKKWGLPLAGCAAVIASGHHSMAIGVFPAFWLLCFYCRKPAFYMWLSLALFLLFSCFRLLWMWEISQCDAGGLECFSTVALGSSEESVSAFGFLQRALWDRFVVEFGLGGLVLLLALLFSLLTVGRPTNGFGVWLLVMLIGVVALGMAIRSLRPYHLRIIVCPLVIWVAVVISRLGRPSIPIGVLSCCLLWWHSPSPTGRYADVERHDSAGQVIAKQADTVWVEGVSTSSGQDVSPSGVVLSAWLHGAKDIFPNHPSGDILIVSTECLYVDVLASGEKWCISKLGDLSQAQQWMMKKEAQGTDFTGAHDWAVQMHSTVDSNWKLP